MFRNDQPVIRILSSSTRSFGESTKIDGQSLHAGAIGVSSDQRAVCRVRKKTSLFEELEPTSWAPGLRTARCILLAIILLGLFSPSKALAFVSDSIIEKFSVPFSHPALVRNTALGRNKFDLRGEMIVAPRNNSSAKKTMMKEPSWLSEIGANNLRGQVSQRYEVKRYDDGSIYWNHLWFYRPGNLYEVIENRDPLVCDLVLNSINKEKIWEETATIHPLMWSSYIANPWEKRQFMWFLEAEQGVRKIDWIAAFIDLDNDGSEEALFRIDNTTNNINYHSLFLVREPNNALIEQDPLEESYAKTVFRSHRIDLSEFEDPSYKSNKHRFEILKVRQKIYILMSRAFYWTLPDLPRKNRVQILQFRGGDFERVCLLQAKYEIRLKN